MPDGPVRVRRVYEVSTCQTCFVIDINVLFPPGKKKVKSDLTLSERKNSKGDVIRTVKIRPPR